MNVMLTPLTLTNLLVYADCIYIRAQTRQCAKEDNCDAASRFYILVSKILGVAVIIRQVRDGIYGQTLIISGVSVLLDANIGQRDLWFVFQLEKRGL